MKKISITLEGEEAVFFWKDGQAYTEGYDLESEKAVLALTRFGKGVGVLLVAMNTCCRSEAEFRSEVEMFVAGHDKVISGTYTKWEKGQVLFEYLSYSPDPGIRWGGMDRVRLSERHYKRLLKDPDTGIKTRMASLQQLPEKYFQALADLASLGINSELAYNKNCPLDILEIFAHDKDEYVRWHVAYNPSCPGRILELLAHDQDNNVGLVAQNKLAIIKRRGLEV